MPPDAFEPGAFQDGAFQMGGVGEVPSVRDERIPRWLLQFERIGQTTFLSDVGGEVQGQFYVPAVIGVQHSDLSVDLERMAIPTPSATVSISPSALQEHFIDINELGQAKVTISSWDGHTARRVIQADMQNAGWGYDGEATTFRLTEDFRHNPTVPEKLVNFGAGQGFTHAQLVDGARFRAYTWVWGNARSVPAFALLDAGGGNTRYMIAGHNVPSLPIGGDGSPARYRDLTNATYIGVDLTSAPDDPYYDFKRSWKVATAADLVRALVEGHSTYPANELDPMTLTGLYEYLRRFSAAGYVDQEGPLWSLVANRLQREFCFVLYQAGGLLRGAPIDPTAEPSRVLVHGVHLLQLEDQITEDLRYTAFKVRYRYRPAGGSGAGWYAVKQIGPFNSPYLRASEDRWGSRDFGDPVEWKRHANSVDLPDVEDNGTAQHILMQYALLFHRGQRAHYLQLAEFAEIALGAVVALVDPERGYDEKPAILIGREWITPELVVNKFRTIEPFEIPEPPRRRISSAPAAGPFDCWDIGAPAAFEAAGGPGGEPAVVLAGEGPGTMVHDCSCGLTTPAGGGYYLFGAKIYACIPEPAPNSWGFQATLNVYSAPDCASLEATYFLNSTDSGGAGVPAVLHEMDHAIASGFVAAGKHVTLDIALVNDTPGSPATIWLVSTYLEFSATEPSGFNDDAAVGTC